MATSHPKASASAGAHLTEGPIAKTLFVFSLPILLGNVLQTLNGSINAIWVGRLLGETALAATSNANFLMFFLISLSIGISMAAVILVGQNLGARRIQEAKKVVGTSTSFFFILSVITGVLGIVFSPGILELLETPEEAMDMAIVYTQIIFAGMPFLFGFSLIMAIMRGARRFDDAVLVPAARHRARHRAQPAADPGGGTAARDGHRRFRNGRADRQFSSA